MAVKRAVVFDWGGVLMRTEDYGPRRVWDNRLGLSAGSVEAVVHGIPAWEQVQRGELDIHPYWLAVANELNLSAEALRDLRNDFYSGDQLDPNLISLIRTLRQRGIRVGLLSNNSRLLLGEMKSLGVDHLFDAVVISAEIGVMKPHPRAYLTILEGLDIQAQDAVMIDDAAANVKGAQAVGMSAIQFTPGLDLQAALDGWLQK
jgi:putative hydrolase of the HAD superfamily